RDGAGFDIVDLIRIAEIWGSYLVPLPFIPTLLLHRWTVIPDDYATRRLTYSLAPAGMAKDCLAPFGQARETLTAASCGPVTFNEATPGRDAENWSPTLPFANVSFSTQGLPQEALREIAILGAAELVGVALKCLERSNAYSQERI